MSSTITRCCLQLVVGKTGAPIISCRISEVARYGAEGSELVVSTECHLGALLLWSYDYALRQTVLAAEVQRLHQDLAQLSELPAWFSNYFMRARPEAEKPADCYTALFQELQAVFNRVCGTYTGLGVQVNKESFD